MADSDNTTTLPAVTRRKLLATATFTAAVWPIGNGTAAATISLDPAVQLWEEWKNAHCRVEQLCRTQQSLETKLFAKVGFPCATVPLPKGGQGRVLCPEELEARGTGTEAAPLHERAKLDLAAHQARWDAADAELGYSAAKQAEEGAAEREQKLAVALSATPATTIAGVAGKLDAILQEGKTSEECSEFPWPQIRSALHDLVRISGRMLPGQGSPAARRRTA